jgi:hypothetical protein
MKYTLIFAFLAVFNFSCRHIHGSGNIVSEKRETGDFTGIDAGGAFEIELKAGPLTEVKVEADDNVISYIRTKVAGGVLEIGTEASANFSNAHYKVYITAPHISMIHSSGAASIEIKGTLTVSGKLSVTSSGASNITAEIEAMDVDVQSSGASTLKLSGKSNTITAHASGSSVIKADSLLSDDAEIYSDGASAVYVNAGVRFKGDASGASGIHYKGSVGSIEKKVSGAASIERE